MPVIDIDEAKNYGLNIDDSKDSLDMLKIYKRWVSQFLTKPLTQHLIEYYIPEKYDQDKEDKNKSEQK